MILACLKSLHSIKPNQFVAAASKFKALVHELAIPCFLYRRDFVLLRR